MASYAAFLRGVNLGSKRRVSGADLAELFEAAGFRDVATFRTSGNVVFGADHQAAAKLVHRIEAALEPLGFEVEAFVRAAAEMREIAAHEPFSARLLERSEGRLQVILLGASPSRAAATRALELGSDDDRLALGARELYWLPRGGEIG